MKKHKPLSESPDEHIANALWSTYSPKIKWHLRRDLAKQIAGLNDTGYIKFLLDEELMGQ